MPDAPRISLVIPAWNEAAYLPRLLDTVEEARRQYRHGTENVQVIVADNVSTDGTAGIAHARGCEVVTVQKRCIAAVRNGGAAVATAPIICFVDADFRIHPQTFNYIESIMETGRYVGGGTGVVMERWSAGLLVTWYLMMPALRLLGLEAGVWFACREDYQQVGGYDESVRYSEDVRFLLALKRLGRKRRPRQKMATQRAARRLGIPAAIATVSTRKFDKYGDWHMLPMIAKGFFWLLFDRRKVDAFAQRYFYEDRLS